MAPLTIRALAFAQRGPYDFTVRSGECLGLEGASGAGKTLLLRAIADLDPHEGSVLLGDLDCREISGPAWRTKVGLLPAESHWWHDRVGEHFRELDPDDLERLRLLGFDRSVLSWQVSRLSTGEKQRLALVRLLQNQPEALLLDEPTGNLHSSNVAQVEQVLQQYRLGRAVPLLWVSHDPEQLGRVAARVMHMHRDGSLEMLQPGRA